MTWTLPGTNTNNTHATVIRPIGGEWEYILWAIGTGTLR